MLPISILLLSCLLSCFLVIITLLVKEPLSVPKYLLTYFLKGRGEIAYLLPRFSQRAFHPAESTRRFYPLFYPLLEVIPFILSIITSLNRTHNIFWIKALN
jgi:hypothetical protein